MQKPIIALSWVLPLFLSGTPGFAKIKLPRLIGDGMVLQAGAPVRIWGWASAREAVAVDFLDAQYAVQTSDSGTWEVLLPALNPGGPFTMTVRGADTVTIQDILIGDVWICSGQSNMELPMARVRPLYETEIAEADNPFIRYFEIPKIYDFKTPHTDVSGGEWQPVNRESILKCSAAAYFFAKSLYDRNHVPIGLINASLGGSPAEAWISESALKAFPDLFEEAQRFKDDRLIQAIETADKSRSNHWYEQAWSLDSGYRDPDKPWFAPDLDDSGWVEMPVPGYWSDGPLGNCNGVVWYRKDFRVPASMTETAAKLNLGRIVDADSVYVNGVFVGAVSYQYPPRWYVLPKGLLREGRNQITVRVINTSGKGGFVLDKPYELTAGTQRIDLKGRWKVKPGAKLDALEGPTFIRWKPLGLFNAMIAPLLNYRIKGVIWYQGESNTKMPERYQALFSTMIGDWRSRWRQGDFPFLYVQLANFMEVADQPSESNWAALREAQRRTLSVPNTGMAVTIDVGEWNDIHPLNKKAVGERLALAALNIAYGANIEFSGPAYQSMRMQGDTVVLTFTHTGGGLLSGDGKPLRQFSIAGADRRFQWARAEIRGDKVYVWNDQVHQPATVRYAWADNPEGANLYNQEGLPASPFEAQ